ncbi:chlorophyllase/cutinase-like alpha/beta fold protein [Polyangium spumosum]|uniref:poly(ethylene terephthalate) hydrolase family protein n=1 Tax=Polyangium spumosum TaxID=889282 RepID=UPI0014790E1A
MVSFSALRHVRRLLALGIGSGSLLSLLSGCAPEAPPSNPDTGPKMPEGDLLDYPVDAPGPFRVGYRSFLYTYQPKGVPGPREIRVNLWYPTLDEEGTPPRYINVFPDEDVFEGASVAPPMEAAGYPVHLHSHGYSGFGGTSSDMMRWFASHGWVAVAPDHKGNTLPEHEDTVPLTMSFLRPMDLTASLDALEALPADDPLSGKCRTDEVLLSGHSFGGRTAWATGGAVHDLAAIQAMCDAGSKFSEPCTPEQIAVFGEGLGEPRVAAAIPMASGVGADEPGWFGYDGYDAVNKPFMQMSGSLDPVGAENVWSRVTSIDFTWLDFEGGCHQLFALGGCPEFDSLEGWALVNKYAFAFARRHVLADTSDEVRKILDGTEVLSPKVKFQHK